MAASLSRSQCVKWIFAAESCIYKIHFQCCPSWCRTHCGTKCVYFSNIFWFPISGHDYRRISPHYIDVIMTTMESQITSLMVVYSIVYSGADQRKYQSSAPLAFVRGVHRDRWIPRTKGQLRRKCFHLLTSSCLPVNKICSMLLALPTRGCLQRPLLRSTVPHFSTPIR